MRKPEILIFFSAIKLPRAVKALLLDAWNQQLWIYDQLTGTWFTPEEFKADWHLHVTSIIYIGISPSGPSRP